MTCRHVHTISNADPPSAVKGENVSKATHTGVISSSSYLSSKLSRNQYTHHHYQLTQICSIVKVLFEVEVEGGCVLPFLSFFPPLWLSSVSR